jgi:hypothetical protein
MSEENTPGFDESLRKIQNSAFQLGIEYTLREVRRLYKTGEEFNKLVAFLRKQSLYDLPEEPNE